MLGRTTKRVLSILGVTMLTATGVAAEGGATETEDSSWLVDIFGHPLEPYTQMPDEIQTGFPSSSAGLEGVPHRCQTTGAIYDLGLGEGVILIVSENQYKNPTRAHAINPASSRPVKEEIKTVPGGPGALADCASPLSGMGQASTGPLASEALSVAAASTRSTTTKKEGEQLIVSETLNQLKGIQAGEMRIGSLLSWLKVEYHPSAEPKISYRIELGGINDGKQFSGAGQQGLVLAGQNVAGDDLAKQFNEQAKANEKIIESLGVYGFRVLEPRLGVSASGRYIIEVAGLDASFAPAARRGTLGQAMGIRLGMSRAAGRYETTGKASPMDGYSRLKDPSPGVS